MSIVDNEFRTSHEVYYVWNLNGVIQQKGTIEPTDALGISEVKGWEIPDTSTVTKEGMAQFRSEEVETDRAGGIQYAAY